MPTRRSKPYLIKILRDKEVHRIAGAWWHDFVQRGLLVVIHGRTAQPRAGMAAWVENGGIRLLDLRTGEMFFIRLNCQQIERMAIYDTRGPSLTPEQIRQEVERDYCLRV